MDILRKLSNDINSLNVGEQWNITAQALFLSRNDFQSIAVYLCREAKKGHFSIAPATEHLSRTGATCITVVKN